MDPSQLHGSAIVIAVSGLLLVVFLVAHLGGASLALFDPAAFEAWAALLHRQIWLPPLELSLALALLAHPLLALRRSVLHAAARGPLAGGGPVSRRQGGLEPMVARAGRLLPWSGAALLLFLAVHLGQLRLARPEAGAELALLQRALEPPLALALYVVAGLALLLHLLHGTESAHRSLGLLQPANRAAIRGGGRLLALLLGAGFALLPLALAWRWSGPWAPL